MTDPTSVFRTGSMRTAAAPVMDAGEGGDAHVAARRRRAQGNEPRAAPSPPGTRIAAPGATAIAPAAVARVIPPPAPAAAGIAGVEHGAGVRSAGRPARRAVILPPPSPGRRSIPSTRSEPPFATTVTSPGTDLPRRRRCPGRRCRSGIPGPGRSPRLSRPVVQAGEIADAVRDHPDPDHSGRRRPVARECRRRDPRCPPPGRQWRPASTPAATG